MSSEDRIRLIRNGLLIAVGGAALAACSNGANMAMSPPPPPQEAFFGAGFASDFEANPNSTPATPQASDIIPVSSTTQPQAVTFPSGS